MSLSGNLGFVSLDEILRLLIRSGQKGAVDISGQRVRGRVFVADDGVSLATTAEDAGLRDLLTKSDLVGDTDLAAVADGETTLASLAVSSQPLVDFLREMTVESIYQLSLHGEGFEVRGGATTAFGASPVFELEELLADSRQRLSDWAEVSAVVGDLHASMQVIRDLGDRDRVEIDRESWMILSEIGSGSSVSQIAGELGTTEFWAARAAARLINMDLVVAASEAHDPGPQSEVSELVSSERTDDEQIQEWDFDGATGDPEPDVDPDQSWWQEPEPEESEDHAPGDALEVIATALLDDDDDDSSDTVPATPGDADDSVEIEDDTEAFLEKVFSELEATPEEPREEGYGLLRRRRMGAMRDASNDV